MDAVPNSLAHSSAGISTLFGKSVPYIRTPFARACRAFPALGRGASIGQIEAAKRVDEILQNYQGGRIAIGVSGATGVGKTQLLKVLRAALAPSTFKSIDIVTDDPGLHSRSSDADIYITSLQPGAAFPSHLIEGRKIFRILLKGFNAQELSERFWIEGQSSLPGWLIKRVVADGLGSFTILNELSRYIAVIEKRLGISIPQDIEPPFFNGTFQRALAKNFPTLLAMPKGERRALIDLLEPPREERYVSSLARILESSSVDQLGLLRNCLSELQASLSLPQDIVERYRRLIENHRSEPRIVISIAGNEQDVTTAYNEFKALREHIVENSPLPYRSLQKSPVALFRGHVVVDAVQETLGNDSVDFLEELMTRGGQTRTELLARTSSSHVFQLLISEHYLADYMLRLAAHAEYVACRHQLGVERSLPFRNL